MALVRFLNAWFGPHSHYFFPGEHEVPDDYLDQLPETAVRLDKPEPIKVKVEEKVTLIPPVEDSEDEKPEPKSVRRRVAPTE